MALGKNINIKKSPDDKSSVKKPISKKKIEKKQLIAKKPIKKRIAKRVEEQSNSPVLQFITEEANKKKVALRKQYIDEIEQFKDKIRQFIVFKIGRDEYAINIELINEVVPFTSLVKIPKAPKHVKGATIVRDQTLTAFDLQAKLVHENSQEYLFTVSLKSENKVGLLVSELPLALKISGSNIDSDLSSLESIIPDETYIKGVIKYNERLIFYLDINGLIDGDKAIVVPNEIAEKV